MSRAAFAFFHGHTDREFAATHLVVEYLERKRLAEIGLVSNLGSLPVWKADAFVVISGKESEIRAKKA